jgi:hypothetical protein
MSEKSIRVEYGLCVKGCVDNQEDACTFDHMDVPGGHSCWRYECFAERSKLMDSLVDGALVIEVKMKLADPTKTPPPFIPENPSACKIIQGMFMNEESADIVFNVGGEQFESNARKKAKTTSSVAFPAHRIILRECSPTLAELCGPEGDKITSIKIPDVSPVVFHHMLYHLYGGKVAHDDMKSHAKEIVNVADKYGVVDLKLEAEAVLVKTTVFSVEKLLDLLLYAESKNCALLKEAVLDFMLANAVDVLKNTSFNDAPGAFISDVLAATVRESNKGGTDDCYGSKRERLSVMRISELRWKAHKNGIKNVDGSREMLIAALEDLPWENI